MLRNWLLGIASAVAIGGAALVSPASAQVPPPMGGPGWGPPPAPGYAPPPRYRPYAPPPPPVYRRRCWREPVRVWDGWEYVIEYRRVCR